MWPILFELFGVNLYAYSVLLALGIVGGAALAYRGLRRLGHPPSLVLDAVMWTLFAGLLGGRAWYVAVNWPYFATKPVEIVRAWEGGLGFPGAFLGGLVALVLQARVQRVSFWALADAFAPGLALGGTLGWLGALLHGSAYGIVYEGPLNYDLPDLFGLVNPRFPTQGIAVVWCLLILAVVWLQQRRPAPAGTRFLLYVLLYSMGMFGLEFMRGDETIFIGTWRLAQIFYLGGIVVSLAAIIIRTGQVIRRAQNWM